MSFVNLKEEQEEQISSISYINSSSLVENDDEFDQITSYSQNKSNRLKPSYRQEHKSLIG